MQITLVIPTYNEEESIPELCAWIDRVMKDNGYSYEALFVDDGSKDKSWAVVQEIHAKNPSVKGIRFRRNYGKSAALNKGFEAAQGDVVITMDADLQDSPDEIPELYRLITEEGYDLISGWKQKRYDPITKTLPTKLYNWATRKMSGIYLHDFNCGLKAYKNEVVKSVEVYGEMHRYIPVLAKRAGYDKIGEKIVQHQARKYGVTKFGLERFVNGFLDLLSISFVTRFGRKPMHLFGSIGSVMFLIGFFAAAIIGGMKIYYLQVGVRSTLVTDIPWFYIALTSMILGTQLFLAGFLAELVARNDPKRNDYQVSERLEGPR
ncbi:glycosyltransferase [bacterium SCSIO 12741]|nr:glycosyltransferase [bacterium SCSIO 12741]